LLSQLWKFALHTGAHAPSEQLLLEVLFAAHALPQAPQLVLSVANTIVQPLFGLPPHVPNWVPQLGVQLLATQLFVPCGAWQATPHAPQLLLSEVGSDSQPSIACLLQSKKPLAQVLSSHALATHLPVAWSGANSLLQFVPQLPQFAPSRLVFVPHARPLPAQSTNGGVQVLTTHFPASHLAVPFATLHTLPHLPQLFGSVCKFTSQPSVKPPALPALQSA
jgi:hypothetical protein